MKIVQFPRADKAQPTLGYPPDFPDEFVVITNRLAAADSVGYPVDPITFKYTRDTGEIVRVRWMPAAQFDDMDGAA